MNKKLLYFGCEGQAGHYLSVSDNEAVHKYGLPYDFVKRIDATFCPPQWKPGYFQWRCPFGIVVAWWDTTGDKRPGSNSVLIGIGDWMDSEELIDEAYKEFPKVMNRQPRPKPYEP